MPSKNGRGVGGAAKTPCNITRSEFRAKARAMKVTLTDPVTGESVSFIASPKEFSSKSLGWGVSEKATLNCGGTPVRCQVGMNFTIVNSATAVES